MYEFSVDNNSIEKYDTLNIHKYLMTKSNIKQYLAWFFYYYVLVNLQHAEAKDSDQTKCLFLNDKSGMVRPGLTDMNLVEFKYHPFMIRLNICNGSFTVLSPKIRVLKLVFYLM